MLGKFSSYHGEAHSRLDVSPSEYFRLSLTSGPDYFDTNTLLYQQTPFPSLTVLRWLRDFDEDDGVVALDRVRERPVESSLGL